MTVYTKRGDTGETSTFEKNNEQKVRITKDSLIVEALGSVDELNSYLGVVYSFSESPKLQEIIHQMQTNLLTIGSTVAGAQLQFTEKNTKDLEKIIDELEGKLPVLSNFVYPRGTQTSAQLQYARSLARRCERRVVSLSKQTPIRKEILTYLNRLSDALFTLARNENWVNGIEEETWIGKRK
jgi:cob(I)alamin adenosyltransferase